MDLYEFNTSALKTEAPIAEVKINGNFLLRVLSIFNDSASMLDCIKKNVVYGKSMDWDNIRILLQNIYSQSDILISDTEDLGTWYESTAMKIDVNPRMFHALLGICTEAGEIGEVLDRGIKDCGQLDTVNILEEFGDIDWYKAIAFDEMGVDPHDPLEAIINKLQLRYPNKFASDAAINRNLEAERKSLENDLD